MLVTQRALHTRALLREVFEEGAYVPLSSAGARHDCLFAFSRQHGGDAAITCVPRLIASLIPDVASPPVGSAVWADTRVELPVLDRAAYARPFRDVFTNVRVEPRTVDGRLTVPASQLFERFPVALLVPCPP
jgi:(1->4)-alpha-D-glucan 1-alpha-D-glucosylmutase